MKQIPLIAFEREPSLREILAEQGILSWGEKLRRQRAERYARVKAGRRSSQEFADPLLHVPCVADPLGTDEAHPPGT